MNPSIPALANAAGYKLVPRSMAEKSIGDTRDAGLRFLRVAVTGYRPDNLTPWLEDPSRYWAAVDQMFDDLDQTQTRLVPTFLWPISQFADSRNDPLETVGRCRGCATHCTAGARTRLDSVRQVDSPITRAHTCDSG